MTDSRTNADDQDVIVVMDDADQATAAPRRTTPIPTTPDDTPEPHPVVAEVTTRARRRLAVASPSRQTAPAISIADEPLPVLDGFNPWEGVAEADRALRQGRSPQVEREQSADVLHLGRQNGKLLWILLGLCATLVAGTFLNAFFILNMPARGVPSTEQVGLYHRTDHSQEEISAFAERITGRMRTWKYQTIKTVPRLVLPYLDPSLRGQWQSEFEKDTEDATSYRERSLFEPVKIVYRGIKHETTHIVDVYYQEYHGRGEVEGVIKFEAIARRLKHLEIAEGATNSENIYGLYVVRHIDVPERAYLENATFAAQANPWDEGLGIKVKKKPKPKPKVVTEPAP